MESLIEKNNDNNNDDDNLNIEPPYLEDFNTKKHHIFLRLNAIINNEKKNDSYKNIVFRLFTHYLIYLEKINSKSIKIIYKNGKKYFYTKRLYLKDAENYFLNTHKKDSTKYYYLNIIKKYIKILNKNSNIKFTESVKLIYPNQKNKIKTNTYKPNIINIIQKLKNINNVEFLCCFYILYFFGLSFYQLSKLTLKNYKSNLKKLVFISYKYKKKIIKKKKIDKNMEYYFDQFFKTNNNKISNYLFFNDVTDKIGNTRKNQIEKIFENLFIKTLKLSKNETKEYMEELNVERSSKRIGPQFQKLLFP